MNYDFGYYFRHYFSAVDFLKFFLLGLGVLFVLFVVLYLIIMISANGYSGMERKEKIRIEWHVLMERYYEMIFSGTSVLMFMSVYYLIDRFVTDEEVRVIWEKYDDFALMFLIIISCFFISFLDRVFVKLLFLNRSEKSACRLTGMFYMIIIFMYIKFIYKDDNYDMLIIYLLGLMIGRFAYFDSTVHDFIVAMRGVIKNIPLMIFSLAYTGVMCMYGFSSDYLLVHNGVIVNVFISHLFMCLAIFVLYHVHIAELVTGWGNREGRKL